MNITTNIIIRTHINILNISLVVVNAIKGATNYKVKVLFNDCI